MENYTMQKREKVILVRGSGYNSVLLSFSWVNVVDSPQANTDVVNES